MTTPTPHSADALKQTEAPELRMDAYYYGFDKTGVPEIDRVLSAVACAGKAFHRTDSWGDAATTYPGHAGETPVDWIQNAANDAAAAWNRRPTPASPGLVELRRLAEAATAGPWHKGPSGSVYSTSEGYGLLSADTPSGRLRNGSANEAYIALANPAAILALLDRLERAEAAAGAVPEGTAKKIQEIAQWMDSQANQQQTGLDTFDYASQFDYELAQAASELSMIANNLAAAPPAQGLPAAPSCDCAMFGKDCKSIPPAAAPSEPVACTHGQAYGIIDPDYARYYSIIRCTAWQYGYAIGMHGSFTRDLDLIAVPWADNACAPDKLVKVICGRTDLTEHHKNPTEKPHGRLVFTLMLPGFGDPRWVDLSIVPTATPPAQDAGTGALIKALRAEIDHATINNHRLASGFSAEGDIAVRVANIEAVIAGRTE